MLLSRISSLCKKKGISIARLERETGISNGTIRNWDSRSPNIENVRKVAEFFNVSIDSLVSDAPTS